MQPANWIAFLSRLSAEEHTHLLFSVNNGHEIAAQEIVAMESDFLLIRGRLGGSSDANRVFCIPYDRLTYVWYTHSATPEVLAHLSGKPIESFVASTPQLTADIPAEAPAPEPAKTEAPPPPALSVPLPEPPRRSAVSPFSPLRSVVRRPVSLSSTKPKTDEPPPEKK
jgi:hypothetical protein